jgi:hypothetical protein
MLKIGVFCSSLDGEKIFSEKTKELGAVIAKENYSLVYGGGKLGLMGDLAKSVKENGSAVISVIPSYLNKPNIIFDESDKIYETKNLFERKKKLIGLSDVLIALPGGIGTLDEVFDVLALFALGEINKNIFLLNINNFWLPFLEIIQHLKTNKMIRASDDKFIEARSLKNLYVVSSIEEIFSHPQFI